MQRFYFTLVAIATLISSGVGSAADVQFPAAPPATLSIPAQLREPPKDGPHPAMILLHSAGGVAGDRQLGEYQDRLLGAGFAALVVDSYSPRGRANMLQWDPEFARQRLFDAGGALGYLQTLPTVDRHPWSQRRRARRAGARGGIRAGCPAPAGGHWLLLGVFAERGHDAPESGVS